MCGNGIAVCPLSNRFLDCPLFLGIFRMIERRVPWTGSSKTCFDATCEVPYDGHADALCFNIPHEFAEALSLDLLLLRVGLYCKNVVLQFDGLRRTKPST